MNVFCDNIVAAVAVDGVVQYNVPPVPRLDWKVDPVMMDVAVSPVRIAAPLVALLFLNNVPFTVAVVLVTAIAPPSSFAIL